MRKLLALGDGGCKTGFARVTRGVLDYLHNTGRWEVELRGVNWRQNHKIPYPYQVLPVATRQEDPFGFEATGQHIKDAKPDVMWMVQDLWNLGMYATKKPAEIPTVGYFPVDCPNMKPHWAMALGAFSEAVAYTKFGAREAAAGVRRAIEMMSVDATSANVGHDTPATWVSTPMGKGKVPGRLDRFARWQNVNAWNVIPHGVDLAMFGREDKAACRRMFGLPESAFIIGCVNTNQFRKRQDIALRVLVQLARTVPEAMVVFHCAGGDSQGWDLAQLADYLKIGNRVVLVHHQAPFLSDEQLRALYNSFDVHINTSGGEGFGLTSIEAGACGIPQLVPNWSATREIWAGAGVLLPVQEWRFEPKALNTAHCLVDVERTAALLEHIAKDSAYCAQLGVLAYERAKRQFGWDVVGRAFEDLLMRALKESPPQPVTVNQLLADKSGAVESELAGLATMTDYHKKYGSECVQPLK